MDDLRDRLVKRLGELRQRRAETVAALTAYNFAINELETFLEEPPVSEEEEQDGTGN